MRRTVVLLACLAPSVALGGFRASSFRKETKLGANYWNAASALDNNLGTCWMVDAESENVGEWFEVDIPKGTVDKIAAVIGWEESDETRTDYARLKNVTLQVIDTSGDEEKVVLEHPITFEDTAGWQVIDVPDAAVGGEFGGGRVRLTVKDIYPGVDYPSLAVSEVRVELSEMDAPGAFRDAPESVADGHAADAMFDDDARTFWASAEPGAGQTFSVQASGFGLSSVGLHPGPASHARPKTVEISINNQARQVTLADAQELQWVQVPAIIGYTGSAWGAVQIKVIDTYPGKSEQGVGISEIKLRATHFEG